MGTFEAFISFLLYSVVGWGVDTAFRTVTRRRYTRGGFSRYPFSPIYGFGVLLVLVLVPLMQGAPLWTQWLALSFILGTFEYLGGFTIVKVTKHRLWNYTKDPFDIDGHTTPLYALTWGALSLLIAYILHPWLLSQCAAFGPCAQLLSL